MPKYCISGTDYSWAGDLLDSKDNFEMLDINSEILLPSGEILKLSADTLTYDFMLNEE